MDDQAEDELFGPLSEAPIETVQIEAAPQHEEAVEQPPEAAPPAAPEPPRDDAGRFVPLDALKEERSKRQELAEELASLKRQMVPQRQPAPIPDPFDDPNAYAAYQDQRMQQALDAQRFQLSDVVAKQTYGAEKVEQAAQWATERAKADLSFAASYMRQPHPIDWIVQQHKRDAILSQIPTDVSSLEEYIEREIAKRTQPAPSVVAAQIAAIPKQASPPVKVPRSLATQGSGPSDIRDVATGPLAGVDAVFNA